MFSNSEIPMFDRNQHSMSISPMAIFLNMAMQQCQPGVLFSSFVSSFISIYTNVLFLGRVFILFRHFVISGVDVSLFRSAKRTDLESESIINLEDLW